MMYLLILSVKHLLKIPGSTSEKSILHSLDSFIVFSNIKLTFNWFDYVRGWQPLIISVSLIRHAVSILKFYSWPLNKGKG